MSRKMSFVILILFVMSSVITGCGGEVSDVVVAEALSPAQERAQSMDWAHSYGEIIFIHTTGAALCEGNTYLATLDAGEYNRLKLSSQEALNLTLCKRSAETGNYNAVQDIPGVAPGDYLFWDEANVLHWTRYIPQ